MEMLQNCLLHKHKKNSLAGFVTIFISFSLYMTGCTENEVLFASGEFCNGTLENGVCREGNFLSPSNDVRARRSSHSSSRGSSSRRRGRRSSSDEDRGGAQTAEELLKTADISVSNICTSDQMEYLRLKRYDLLLRMDLYRSLEEWHGLWEEINRLKGEGYELPEQDNSLMERHNRLEAQFNTLRVKHNSHWSKFKSESSLANKIHWLSVIYNLLEELENLNPERIAVAEMLTESFGSKKKGDKKSIFLLYAEADGLSEESSGLESESFALEADYFKFALEVCGFLARGHQLTARGKDLTVELGDLKAEHDDLSEEYDRLITEYNKFLADRHIEDRISISKEVILNIKNKLQYARDMKSIQEEIIDTGFSN